MISEFWHVLDVNLLEIDGRFGNGGKIILSRSKSSLSSAESEVSDDTFFRTPLNVSTTALVIACSVPQCRCKM